MEFMPNFQLHRPETIEEALQARTDNDEALYVAGGTDMLVNVRRGIEQPKNLVDLSAISGMKSITVRQRRAAHRSRCHTERTARP